MAHRNNQSRTPRTSHHLQDDRLFSLSGGIPPEHFDDLNFISMRRGRRLAAPAPTGDLWGYYAECREFCRMEADKSVPEPSTQPRTELSTEAMDTDEGQRTTARILEEAHHLSSAAREHTYASIDEMLPVTLQGSEAAISDILLTPDPREIHKVETGGKSPTPVEMKASLPAGSFSPFDFEQEFHMRHGMNPEDADKPWCEYYQPQGLRRRTRNPDEERKSTSNESSCAASLIETIETLQTPGVVRNDTGRELYAENILAFDARLLQDIISGRWSRQQMYDSNPGWYQDSFYDLTPPWVGQCRESPPTFENARSLPIYTPRHRYLPLGPPSDIASTTGPPSTIGPSASENGVTTTTKKVDFDMKPDSEETSSTSSQLYVPRSDVTVVQSNEKPLVVEGRTSEGISQLRDIFHMDERRQTPDATSLEVKDMDITTSEYDVYYGVYPDFQLPLPNRP